MTKENAITLLREFVTKNRAEAAAAGNSEMRSYHDGKAAAYSIALTLINGPPPEPCEQPAKEAKQ